MKKQKTPHSNELCGTDTKRHGGQPVQVSISDYSKSAPHVNRRSTQPHSRTSGLRHISLVIEEWAERKLIKVVPDD